jgi:hypothetical protein
VRSEAQELFEQTSTGVIAQALFEQRWGPTCVPSPNSPAPLSPQHSNAPLDNTAHVFSNPAPSAVAAAQFPPAHAGVEPAQAPLAALCHCPSFPQYCGVWPEHWVGTGLGEHVTHPPLRHTGIEPPAHAEQT